MPIPISIKNIPRSPYLRREFTDILGDFVPHCLVSVQVDPHTGRNNKVYSIDLGERDIWPSYDISHLRKGPGFGGW